MDKLANEDHTHHITPDEIRVYRNNWWIRSNFVGPDSMPVRHRAAFKEALSTLRHLKNQEDIRFITKIGGKALLHLGGIGKIPGGVLHQSVTATMDPALIDRGNLMDGDWANYSCNYSQNSLMQNYSDNSVTANSSLLSPTGCVKSVSPI